MNIHPQQVVAPLVVAVALTYLSVRLLGLRKSRRGTSCGSGCGSCAAHPGGEAQAPANLIAVETLRLREK